MAVKGLADSGGLPLAAPIKVAPNNSVAAARLIIDAANFALSGEATLRQAQGDKRAA